MPVPNIIKSNIVLFMQDLVFELEINQDLFEHIVSTNISNFKQKMKRMDFNLSELNSISERLGVPLHQMLTNTINWQSIKSRLLNYIQEFPITYTKFGGTPITSIRSILSYITNKFNSKTTQTLLDNLETHRESLVNDGLYVNAVFLNKLFKFCTQRLCLNEQDLREMSYILYQQTQRNLILSLAKNCRSDRDILSLMVKNSTKYEKNFQYDLKVFGDFLLISSIADQEIHDGLKLKELTSPEVLLFKKYTMENTTLLMGLKPMRVLEVESKFVNGQQHVNFLLKENNLRNLPDNVYVLS